MLSDIDVRVEHLSKNVVGPKGIQSVLEDIDFEVRTGEFLTIVGPSGCGKTTLLRIIAGLDAPTSGKVWLNPDRLIKGTSFVEQVAMLLSWRTLLQNAALGLELKHDLSDVRLEIVGDLIFEFGLKGKEKHRSDQLSTGMRQRVALVRALASGPTLLYCDEPFASIDFVQRLLFTEELRRRCAVEGITTLFVTHNIDEAIFLGHRVMVLGTRPGRIAKIHSVPDSIGVAGAVGCRALPEFQALFTTIWDDLRGIREAEG